jgi:hypothetical protein
MTLAKLGLAELLLDPAAPLDEITVWAVKLV